MKNVKIMCAGYGSKSGVVRFGHVAKVADPEAERLIEHGYAVEEPVEQADSGEEITEAETTDDGTYSESELMKLTRAELDDLAAGIGLDGTKCKTKSDVALLILNATSGVHPENGMEEQV